MINFTVGPVQMEDYILEMGKNQIPYFRTPEFSEIMFENERMMKMLTNASEKSKAVFLTGSGTAAMEAAVVSCLSEKDKVLVVNGGSFGARFALLCEIHRIPYTEIKLEPGETLTEDKLEYYDGKGYTAFLVNIHETSTGVYYDPILISEFCRKNSLFLIVDAVSSFLADSFEMEAWNVNVMLTGSQKALAVPPGISVVVLDEEAQKRINENEITCMYLNLKFAMKDAERGQTPYTPAIGILLQINARLKRIMEIGIENERRKIQNIANDFRSKIVGMPVSYFAESMSYAATALEVKGDKDAYKIFEVLKDEYNIWICPNGGELSNKVFRVGHIGALTIADNDCLIGAMKELCERGIL